MWEVGTIIAGETGGDGEAAGVRNQSGRMGRWMWMMVSDGD